MATPQWIGATDTDYSENTNWSTGTAPAANDTVVIPGGTPTYAIAGYDASATAISHFEVYPGSSSTVGTITTAGIVTALQLGLGGTGDSEFIFRGNGAGYYDVDDAAKILVLSGPVGGISTSGLHFVGGEDNDLIYIDASSANIGLCWKPGTTLETDALEISDGNVYIGTGLVKKDGSTLLSPTVSGGSTVCRSGLVTLTLHGGTWTQQEGAITTANVTGELNVEGNDTITTLTVTGGTVDFSGGNGAVTVTNSITLKYGAVFNDPRGRVAAPTFVVTAQDEPGVTINTPNGYTVSRS